MCQINAQLLNAKFVRGCIALSIVIISDVKTEFFSQPIIGLPKPVFYR